VFSFTAYCVLHVNYF